MILYSTVWSDVGPLRARSTVHIRRPQTSTTVMHGSCPSRRCRRVSNIELNATWSVPTGLCTCRPEDIVNSRSASTSPNSITCTQWSRASIVCTVHRLDPRLHFTLGLNAARSRWPGCGRSFRSLSIGLGRAVDTRSGIWTDDVYSRVVYSTRTARIPLDKSAQARLVLLNPT